MLFSSAVKKVLVLLFASFSVNTKAGMVCKQDVLGHDTTLYCNHQDDPFCCVLNGRMSCCSYDDYYREKNGPGLVSSIAIAVFLVGLAALLTVWCWFNHKKKLLKTSEKVLTTT